MARIALNSEWSKETFRTNMDAIEKAINDLSPTKTSDYNKEITANMLKVLMRIYTAHNLSAEQFESMYVDVFTDDLGIDYGESSGILYRGADDYDVTRGGTYVIDTQDEFDDGTLWRTTLGGSGSAPELTKSNNYFNGLWTSPVYDCLGAHAYGDLDFSTDDIVTPTAFSVESDTVALYHFNEITGTAVDDAAENHDGTASSADIWNTGGKYSGCAYFDGTGDTITIPDSDALTPAELTVEFYIKPSNLSYNTYTYICSKRDGSARSWDVYFRDGQATLVISTNGTSWARSISTRPLPCDRFSYVAFTYDGSDIKSYVNGVQSATSTSASGNMYNDTNPITFGAYGGTGWSFTGYLDEFRISNTAHTADEIKSVGYQTQLKMLSRSGNTSSPDSSWSNWEGDSASEQIDACDSITSFATTDSTNLAISLDQSEHTEGSGCLKIAGTVSSCLGESVTNGSYDTDLSAHDYLKLSVKGSIVGEYMRVYMRNALPAIAEDFTPLPNGTFADGTNDWTVVTDASETVTISGNWIKFHHAATWSPAETSITKTIDDCTDGELDFIFYGDSTSTANHLRFH